MDGESALVHYRCTAGHRIEAVALEDDSEIVTVDGGAAVRVCREHGCPLSATAAAGSPSGSIDL